MKSRPMMETMVRDMKYNKAELSATSAKVTELDNGQLQSWMNAISNEICPVKGKITNLKKREKSYKIKKQVRKWNK